jgi:hypothetical protein
VGRAVTAWLLAVRATDCVGTGRDTRTWRAVNVNVNVNVNGNGNGNGQAKWGGWRSEVVLRPWSDKTRAEGNLE